MPRLTPNRTQLEYLDSIGAPAAPALGEGAAPAALVVSRPAPRKTGIGHWAVLLLLPTMSGLCGLIYTLLRLCLVVALASLVGNSGLRAAEMPNNRNAAEARAVVPAERAQADRSTNTPWECLAEHEQCDAVVQAYTSYQPACCNSALIPARCGSTASVAARPPYENPCAVLPDGAGRRPAAPQKPAGDPVASTLATSRLATWPLPARNPDSELKPLDWPADPRSAQQTIAPDRTPEQQRPAPLDAGLRLVIRLEWMTIVCMVLSTLVLGRMVRQARATAGRPTVPVNKAAGRTRRRPWRDVLRAPQPQKLGAKEDGFRREVGKQLPELVAIDGCEIRHHVMELTVSQAAPPWRIGVRSVSGQVRSANEDFARGFVLGDAAALIIGDGCGGVPHGAHASHLAVRAARDSLVSELAERGAECAGHAIAVAFDAATQRLAGAASQIGDDRLNGGLRTTLIVVVGTATEYHWGYIGDGGMVLRRADGTCAAILKPQRGAASNILAASLGPQIAGRPCFGTIARRDGDLLLVGTDGVFDHLCEDFPGQVLKLAINRGGNLDMAAEEVLRGFADEQDEFGYLCDDNLTLGLMMNGQPDVGREFWDLAQRAPNAATT